MSATGRIGPAAAWQAMPKYDQGGLEVHRLMVQVPLVYKDIEHPKIVKDKLDKLKRRQLTLATFRIRLKGRESVAGKTHPLEPGSSHFHPLKPGSSHLHLLKPGSSHFHPPRQTIIYLQGGPGFQSFFPKQTGTWREHAVRFGFDVYLMDQRGTGESSKLDASSLAREGGALDKAAILACHRADSIIRDAEELRKVAIGDHKWTIALGQSFGGFCALSYLSFRPSGINAAILTGGLTDPTVEASDIYKRTAPWMVSRSRTYYTLYPEDKKKVAHLLRILQPSNGGPVEYAPTPPEAFQTVAGAESQGILAKAAPAASNASPSSSSSSAAAVPSASSSAAGQASSAPAIGAKRPRTAAGASSGMLLPPISHSGPLVPPSKCSALRATEGGRVSQLRILSLGLRMGTGGGYKKLHGVIDTLWKADLIAAREQELLGRVRASRSDQASGGAPSSAGVASRPSSKTASGAEADSPGVQARSSQGGGASHSPSKKARTEAGKGNGSIGDGPGDDAASYAGPTREGLAHCIAVRLAMEDPNFDTNPLYAVLHESIYGQGSATRWAAKEAIQAVPELRIPREFGEVGPKAAGLQASGGAASKAATAAAAGKEEKAFLPVGGPAFIGECALPDHFQGDFPGLRGLQLAADVLAEVEDWPPLYDEAVLQSSKVPCVAVVYRNDFFVPRDLSIRTAARYPSVRVWECEQEHTWLREEPTMIREAVRMLAEAPQSGITVPALHMEKIA